LHQTGANMKVGKRGVTEYNNTRNNL